MPAPARQAPARRTHAERSAATQQHLIAAAIGLIQSGTFEDMSMNKLAVAAGMTTGAVQHHFESKAALMMRVLSELVASQDHVGQLWPEASLPSQERARHVVRVSWNLLYSQPRFTAAWNVYLGSRNQPEVVAHIADLRKVLTARMRAGFLAAFPELADDPERDGFVGLVFSSLRGLGLLEMFRPADEATEQQLDCLAALIAQRCDAARPADRRKRAPRA